MLQGNYRRSRCYAVFAGHDQLNNRFFNLILKVEMLMMIQMLTPPMRSPHPHSHQMTSWLSHHVKTQMVRRPALI